MKDIKDVLIDFDRSYSGCYEKNQVVSEDIDFAKSYGAQWRGSDGKQFVNKPKPEFNKIARSVNRILGQFMRMEMNAKIITASDDATDEDAEVLQGRWRNDFNNSDGNEAVHIAADEAFHGGFGALKLVTKYDDEEIADPDYQHIELEPIMGAASSVVFGAGAIRKDKRDAKQAWHIMRVNRVEAEEEYGEFASFPSPITDLSFDWCLGDTNKDIFIAHYYEIVEKRITEYRFAELTIIQDKQTYTDQDGNKLDREVAREWIDNQEHDRVSRKVKCVEYALMAGNRFLTRPRRLPFKSIPIIPMYGYHWVLNGIEYYCGEVSRQKDPQRFENMLMSSLMEIAAAPQVEKKVFLDEQVAGKEQQWADMAVNDYAFLTINSIEDLQGNIIPSGAVDQYNPPQVGTGLQAGLMKLDQMQKEIAGTGQSTLPANASGMAIQAVNDRNDDSYQPMIQNAMQSLRCACETWIPAAKEIYFGIRRTLRVMAADGSFSRVETMQIDTDDNGVVGYNKNTARGQYDVIVKLGESYKTQKESERQTALEMAQFAGSDTEMGQLFLMNAAMSTTGEGSAKLRKIVNYRYIDHMVAMGLPEQEILDMAGGDEMKQYAMQKIQRMQQASAMQQQQLQAQQQAMIQAQLMQVQGEGQARVMEGQAALMNEQNDAVANQIKAFDAETKRLAEINRAQQEGYKIDIAQLKTIADAFQKLEKGNRERTLDVMDNRSVM